MNTFESAVYLPSPLSEVWPFFSDPLNLARLTPPWMHLELAGAPRGTRPGTVVDLRLRVFGVPMRWCSVIDACEPGRRFVDLQLRGPFRYWRHEHRFRGDERGTWVQDSIEYDLPLGRLGTLADRLWVRRTLARMFAYRGQAAYRLLAPRPFARRALACG